MALPPFQKIKDHVESFFSVRLETKLETIDSEEQSLRLLIMFFQMVKYKKIVLGKKKFYNISSLHNIIFNAFPLIFVLWSLLLTNRAFSFLRHSCTKKF